MSDKKLTILAILAAVAMVLAVVQNRISRQATLVQFGSSPLIAGLNVEDVAAIQIMSQQGGQTVTLSQQNNTFCVADKDNYPADVSKINTLISNCLDIRVSDKITSNPDNHADLKVTKDTAAYVITFLKADEQPIVTLLLSPADPDTGLSHGRLLSSNDVYAVQNQMYFNTSVMQYIDADLLDIRRTEVNSVAVEVPGGGYVLNAGTGVDEVVLEDMPEGKQFKGTDYKTVFGALGALRFDDVMSVQNAPSDLVFDYSYVCKLKNLKKYTLHMAKKDDYVYAKISATYLDATPVEKTVGEVESEEELKIKEAKLLAIDDVKKFTAKHRNWIYRIPAYKADDLTKPLSDLLEDIPVSEAEDTSQLETEEAGQVLP